MTQEENLDPLQDTQLGENLDRLNQALLEFEEALYIKGWGVSHSVEMTVEMTSRARLSYRKRGKQWGLFLEVEASETPIQHIIEASAEMRLLAVAHLALLVKGLEKAREARIQESAAAIQTVTDLQKALLS